MKLLTTFKKMNKRERYAIVLAAGVIGIFLLVTFIVEPFLSKTDKLKKSLGEKAVTKSFYYLSRHHDAIRAAAQKK